MEEPCSVFRPARKNLTREEEEEPAGTVTIADDESVGPSEAHLALMEEGVAAAQSYVLVVLHLSPAFDFSASSLNRLAVRYYEALSGFACKNGRDILFDYSVALQDCHGCDTWALAETDVGVDTVLGPVPSVGRDGLTLSVLGDDVAALREVNLRREQASLPALAWRPAARPAALRRAGEGGGGPRPAETHERPAKRARLSGQTGPVPAPPGGTRTPPFEHVVIGGTFDHIHAGHKILVSVAAGLASKTLVVGLSDGVLLAKKKFWSEAEPFVVRAARLARFVSLVNPSLAVDVVPLYDMYGPSGVRPELQALVVSRETESGGPMVNAERARNGVGKLEVVVVDLLAGSVAEDDRCSDPKLSSTQMRRFKARQRLDLDEALRARFMRLPGPPLVLASWWERLRALYSERRRAYHTLRHVEDIFRRLDGVPKDRPLPRDPNALLAVELAAWFHDCVYDPTASDNEERSALLLDEFAAEVAPAAAAAFPLARAMVVATIRHQEPAPGDDVLATSVDGREALRLFLDLDLAVLARPPDSYAQYAREIRAEYAHVPDPDFQTGRRRVLSSLVGRPRLYLSRALSEELEAPARRNVAWEMRNLERVIHSKQTGK